MEKLIRDEIRAIKAKIYLHYATRKLYQIDEKYMYHLENMLAKRIMELKQIVNTKKVA